jgi:prepilin-type N-terminal cleavage/methylation domain-containing protein
MRWRNQSGMTLVELVVTVAIIAILAATVYSSLGNVLQVTESKGASEQVAASIRLARQYAITRGENHCIEFVGTPNTSFRIRVAPNNANCTGTIVQSSTAIGHGLAIVSPANLSIIFDGVGNVKNFAPGNPTVTLQVDTSPHSCRYDVLVTLYGGVRVTEGSC